MDKKTQARVQQLPGLAALDDRLSREWDHGDDREAARGTAREIGGAIGTRREPLDFERDYRIASHAAEVLGDCLEIEDALAVGANWRRVAEEACARQERDPRDARIWAEILMARIHYRGRNYQAAFEYAFGAIKVLRAGAGVDGTRDLLRREPESAFAEMYCAALGIAIPISCRYFAHRDRMRMQILDPLIDDAKALLHREAPPQLWRVHALVSQTFKAIAELQSGDEAAAWLDRLQRFDEEVRPPHARGQLTIRSHGLARAGFEGDEVARRREAEALRAKVATLPRHTMELAESGLLAAGA